jgi:filamentous hemagglutinin family protein
MKVYNKIYKIIIFAGTVLTTSAVMANPVVDNIASGNVTIQQTPSTTVVNQSSQQAIINWQSFNIDASEHTHFQQPAGGVALNRINPTDGPSSIYGKLTATGQIILVNPAGIFFGATAYVNVGGLIASTANISDQQFLNGYYHFNQVSPYAGSVINAGQIIAADHGLVALIGGAVANNGLIQAKLGQIVLASGSAFTMSFANNNLINFSVDNPTSQRGVDQMGNTLPSGVSNTGMLMADGGSILVTAKAAQGVLDNVINMQGVVQAQTVDQTNGEII